MKTRLSNLLSLTLVLLLSSVGAVHPLVAEAQSTIVARPAGSQVGPQVGSTIYLPLIRKSCTTGQTYGQGLVFKAETDNPLRPAYNHADKNLELRSYAIDNTLTNPQKQIQALYPPPSDSPPNLHTLFTTPRVPTVLNVYDVYDWIWASSPNPGTRASGPVNTVWPVTVAGVQVTPGETIRTPSSGYDLGQGVAAIILYAAPTRITLHYTRDDTVAVGYSIHIENICVDTGLVALYNSLESAGRYSQPTFNLVTLTALQPIGTALGGEMQIVVRDTGGFMDPRSLTDWWQ